MEIVTGAINTLLLKFAKLLVGEYKLQKGVKKEIESLQKELISLGAALRKVSEVPVDQIDEQVKIWARDVRELSYDIEDSIDTFMVVAHHQLAREIKDIKKLLEDASKRHERYKIDDAVIARRSESIDPRLGAMYRKETELVGLDGPKNVLVKTLMKDDGKLRQHQDIISIVGFGGLGKTTIANALLHELKVKFDCHFFALVSNKPDIRNILKSILHQLDNKADIFEGLADFQLINKIREFLQNKRFLCVIDDIWEESAWDVIKLALPDGDHGSKIITTTRKMAVAKCVGGAIFELKPLSYDDSYKLLSKRVFDTEDGFPLELSEVTRSILKKCGGLPLAIITIASLLASKPMQIQEWEKVNNSIGLGLGNNLDVDNMRKILSLSYYDLPPHLKTCLLYLSKYPEDTIIRKDILIWSWIAEGFITNEGEQHGKSLQEIGEAYFNELLNKSLIQAVDIGSICDRDGQVHACQVHDMVLELTNMLSAEEGFVTLMPSDDKEEGILVPAVPKKVRRLSYSYRFRNSTNVYATAHARGSLSQVRSFTAIDDVRSLPPLTIFRVLRVLILGNCLRLEDKHLKDFGKLYNLRFLRLGNIRKLPKCIGNLQFLQTLDIRDASSVIQLPPSFVRLRQLVRMIAHRVRLPYDLTLENMKSLQELQCVGLTENLMQGLCDLTGLRILNLLLSSDDDCDIFREAFINSLQKHNGLQQLTLKTPGRFSLDFMQGAPCCLQRFVSNGLFYRGFPQWVNSSLSCLTILSIKLDNYMKQEYLVTLAELPSLRFLRINAFDAVEMKDVKVEDKKRRLIIYSGACAFRCLQEFHFYCKRMGLSFEPRAMQELRRLCLQFSVQRTIDALGEIDIGLENLPSLQHVFVDLGRSETPGEEIQEAEAAIRKATNDHHNNPSLDFGSVDAMLSSRMRLRIH
uniref:AAA+ ATPase domain-containing protein n=1 Tax=Oryza nivara TaxID=4536 RepID=A0A0E0HYD3_ORYNI